jgi:hypothetical protein
LTAITGASLAALLRNSTELIRKRHQPSFLDNLDRNGRKADREELKLRPPSPRQGIMVNHGLRRRHFDSVQSIIMTCLILNR